MKWKRYLVEASIIASLALLVGGIAVIAAYRMFMVYDIPWEHRPLPIPPRETAIILRVHSQSYENDPTGDTIYVTTRDGTVYSNTLFEDRWVPGEPVESWVDDSSWCVAPGPPSDARLWEQDPAPVEKKVLDSAGWRWGHGRMTNIRCYVLYRDGGLEVWTRQKNGLTLAGFVENASLFGACGALVGAVIAGLVLAIRHSMKARAAPTPPDPA